MKSKKTIVDYFTEHLDSGKVIAEVEGGASLSFREVYERSLGRAQDFAALDQKIITAILPNSILYMEYLLAVLQTNNIFNPIPYFVSLSELESVLQYVDPAHIVTDRKDIIEKYGQKYEVIDPASCSLKKAATINKNIDPHKPAALYYSSGTTGDPKGVLYSHHNMTSLIASINRGFQFTGDDNQLAFLPFGHTASINYNILPALMAGSNLYISKGFEFLRNDFFGVLEKHKITYTEIVPTVLLMLLKLNMDISKYDLSSLRFIGCGSSTLPLTSQKEFIEKYGIKVGNLYGLSETGPSHVDYPLGEDWKVGSIGVPLDCNECKINVDGEILLKGPNIFTGYYKNDKLYNQVVKDGWFHTGDIGCERDGKFYFVDRKKDLIIKGGINIVPMEVEEVLYRHKNVHECVVVGREDKLMGEDVVAVIVPRSKDVPDAQLIEELKRHCKEHLSNYKIPAQIFIWDKIPKTHSNKLLRKKVREAINQTADIGFLVEAVRQAGRAAQKAFEEKKYNFLQDFDKEKIRQKSVRELVIAEDILCQDIIIEAVKKAEDNSPIYSEELNNIEQLKTDRSPRKYLIDPLDGTHNFCFGLPYWGLSVAVLDADNQPVAAVVYLPVFDILIKCEGRHRPTLISMSGDTGWVEATTAKKDITQALICYDNQFYKLPKRAFDLYAALTGACFTTRITGSAVSDIALIASGKINARIWNSANPYDIAGGLLIVRQAGGAVSDFAGEEPNLFSKELIMASDKDLNQKIVILFNRSEALEQTYASNQ